MKNRKRLDIEWNIPDMSDKDVEKLIDHIVDIYCDAVVEKLKSAIDKNIPQR